MPNELILLVPNDWCVGEPGDPHHPEIQAAIEAMATIGWVFGDYGEGFVPYPNSGATTVSEVCFFRPPKPSSESDHSGAKS